MQASHVLSVALFATSLFMVSLTIFTNPTTATSKQFMQIPAKSFTSRKMANLNQDDFPDHKMADWMRKEHDSKEQESHQREDFLEGEEAVYHTDYRGVTTHPAPTPKKHLKP
uniref:Uncharacterized protein n=1 Tax=Kalanchoe fedtschenkoi TaxID=63787 RepID=A0A7N0VGS4_KALFE